MEVIDGFQFDWVAKEVMVDQRLDGWVGQEVLIVDNEAVVHVPIVSEVEGCVLKEVVVELMPGVLYQSGQHVGLLLLFAAGSLTSGTSP